MESVNPNFSFMPLLFLVSTSVGFFLAFVLFMKRKANGGNVFLSILLFLFSISIADSVLYWTDYYLVQPDLLGISLSFALFFGPLYYAYAITSLSKAKRPKYWCLPHMIPGMLYLLYLLPFHLTFGPDKLEAIQAWYRDPVNMVVAPLAKIISLVVYGWGVWLFLKREKNHSPQWLRRATAMFLAYAVLLTFYDFLVVLGILQIQWDYVISAAMVVFIYYIGYLGFSSSKLMDGLKPNGKYRSTTLTNAASEHIFEKLSLYLEQHKPYLNPEMRQPQLAQELSLTTHQLSQVINKRAQMSFPDLVNSYRVNEAKALILKGERSIDVAYAVGFNNKTSFYKAFKRFTGLTPNEFKKQKR